MFLNSTRLCITTSEQRAILATSPTSADHDESTTTGEVLGNTETIPRNTEISTLDTIFNITAQWGLESTSSGLQHQTMQLGLISKDFQEQFKAVLWFGFVPAFTLVGIGGNVFGLCFLRYQKFNQPFYQFLFGLMAVDLLYLIIVLFTIPLPIVKLYDQRIPSYIKCYAERSFQLVQSAAYSTCAHIITIMSAERLLSIMLPLKLKAFKYRKYTVVLMIILLLLNMILIVPAFLILQPKEIIDPETNITTCILIPTKWARENMSYSAVILTAARFVPGLATLVANIMIAIFIARQRFKRTSLFATQTRRYEETGRQIKTTVTLMVLSISLLLSLFPSGIATIFKRYFPDTYDVNGKEYFTYLLILDVSYLLRVLSAASDFFIYIFTTNASRESIKLMLKLKCKFCYERNNSNSTTVQSKVTSDETHY